MGSKVKILVVAAIVAGLCALAPCQAADVYALPIEGKADTGANWLVRITHADLTETNDNTAQTLGAVFPVVAKYGVELKAMVLVTAFTDTGVQANSNLFVTVGDGTDADLFLDSTEINGSTNSTEVFLKFGRENLPATVTSSTTNLVTSSTAGAGGTLTTNAYTLVTAVTQTGAAGSIGRKLYVSSDSVDFTFTPDAAYDLEDLDAGEAWFYFHVWDAR